MRPMKLAVTFVTREMKVAMEQIREGLNKRYQWKEFSLSDVVRLVIIGGLNVTKREKPKSRLRAHRSAPRTKDARRD